MQPNYKRPFATFVKKANKSLQLAIEDAVLYIQNSPNSGELKTGDLSDVYVYKFRFNKQEYLIAYQFGKSADLITLIWIDFYQVGSHENFYEELKRYLRQ
jgi:hypothetical protein